MTVSCSDHRWALEYYPGHTAVDLEDVAGEIRDSESHNDSSIMRIYLSMLRPLDYVNYGTLLMGGLALGVSAYFATRTNLPEIFITSGVGGLLGMGVSGRLLFTRTRRRLESLMVGEQ